MTTATVSRWDRFRESFFWYSFKRDKVAIASFLVLLAMVLISALPFLLLFAGIGAIVLFFALRQLRREVEQSPLRESFDLDPTRPIDITPWHQRWMKQWNQRQR